MSYEKMLERATEILTNATNLYNELGSVFTESEFYHYFWIAMYLDLFKG